MACQKEQMARRETYPRTCQDCGVFGPCKKGYSRKWTPSNPIGKGPKIQEPKK